MKLNLKSKAGFIGKYRFRIYKAGTRELIKVTPWIHNLIVQGENTGVNIAVKNLLGDFTYDLEITKASIGVGTTPAADSDTDLEDPVFEDIQIATKEETADNIATFTFFIADAQLPEDDYTEFALWCGTKLFARSIINPAYSKAIGQDAECEYVITINN